MKTIFLLTAAKSRAGHGDSNPYTELGYTGPYGTDLCPAFANLEEANEFIKKQKLFQFKPQEFQLIGDPWYPIDTAPKDGTWITIWSKADGLTHGYWDNEDEDDEDPACWTSNDLQWLDSEPVKPILNPTHWMPIPEPPVL